MILLSTIWRWYNDAHLQMTDGRETSEMADHISTISTLLFLIPLSEKKKKKLIVLQKLYDRQFNFEIEYSFIVKWDSQNLLSVNLLIFDVVFIVKKNIYCSKRHLRELKSHVGGRGKMPVSISSRQSTSDRTTIHKFQTSCLKLSCVPKYVTIIFLCSGDYRIV